MTDEELKTEIDSLGTISEDGLHLTLKSEDFMDVADDYETTDRANWRHGTRDTIVFKHRGHHWRTVVDVHHEDGWQIYEEDVDCRRVVQVEQMVKVWKPG